MEHFCNTHVKYEDPPQRLFFYAIVDPQTRTLDGDRVVFAKLAKIRIARQAQFWDERNWKTIPARLPGQQAESQVRFVAFEDNIIAFEERRPYIPKSTFLRVLPTLYTIAADQALRVLRLELLKDEREVTVWLEAHERVVKVRFEGLRKPNPIDDPILAKIKKEIDETNARNMTFENKDQGVKADEGSLIRSGVKLCQEGYGEFDIEATTGAEEPERRTSREFTLSKRVEYQDDREFIEKTWREKRRIRRRPGSGERRRGS
jgi:hypothetical protein